MNPMVKVFSQKPTTKFKDKYTGQVFIYEGLNMVLKEMIRLGTVKTDIDWWERFEKIGEEK